MIIPYLKKTYNLIHNQLLRIYLENLKVELGLNNTLDDNNTVHISEQSNYCPFNKQFNFLRFTNILFSSDLFKIPMNLKVNPSFMFSPDLIFKGFLSFA